MLLYNTTSKNVHLRAHGNWFEFKVDQIKQVNESLGHFIATDKKDFGIVAIPEEFADMTYRASEEGKAKLAEYKANGIANRVAFLNRQKYNLEVSLKKDLDMKNLKLNPHIFATDKDIENMEELLDYKKSREDDETNRLNKVQAINKKLKEFDRE